MGQNKEGGYGWFVVLASFTVHFIVGGVGYSSSVFQHIFASYYQKDQLDASWISALILGLTAFGGIPAVLFVYQFGHRVTVIIGGMSATIGLLLSIWCQHISEVYITFGAMLGLGLGLCLTPAITVLETYFYKRYATVAALAGCGTPLGIFIFPVLLSYLEEEYAWKGMALILAGVTFNLVLCGAVFAPSCPDGADMVRRRRDLVKLFHPGICRSHAFGGLIFTNFLWGVGISIIYTYLPGYSFHTGHTHDDGVLLIAVSGISAFSSRAVFEVFNRSARLDNVSIFLCTVGITMLLCGLHPELFSHFAGQIGYCIMLGLHTGFWSIFCSFITTEFIGPENMCVGKGYVFLSITAGLMIGTPLAGWVVDYEDDYEIIFYLAGTCLLVSSVIMMSISLAKCYYKPLADWSDSDSESSGVSGNRIECPRPPTANTTSSGAAANITSSGNTASPQRKTLFSPIAVVEIEESQGQAMMNLATTSSSAAGVIERQESMEAAAAAEQEPLMAKSAVSSV